MRLELIQGSFVVFIVFIVLAFMKVRRTRSVIRQNVIGSMSMVVLLIVLGSTGSIALSLAVVMHEGSTVAVVLNALRLLAIRDAGSRA